MQDNNLGLRLPRRESIFSLFSICLPFAWVGCKEGGGGGGGVIGGGGEKFIQNRTCARSDS